MAMCFWHACGRCAETRFPDCEIDMLVYAGTEQLIADNPQIAQIFTIDRNWKKLGVFKQLKCEKTFFKAEGTRLRLGFQPVRPMACGNNRQTVRPLQRGFGLHQARRFLVAFLS